MTHAFFLTCDRCRAIEPIGGNADVQINPRLKALIKNGWHVSARQKDFCPTCVKQMEQESKRGRL